MKLLTCQWRFMVEVIETMLFRPCCFSLFGVPNRNSDVLFSKPSGLYLTMMRLGCYAISTTTLWVVGRFLFPVFVWLWNQEWNDERMFDVETSVSKKNGLMKTMFHSMHFQKRIWSSVSCVSFVSRNAVGGRASAHFPCAMKFSQPTHFIRFPPWGRGNSPREAQCRAANANTCWNVFEWKLWCAAWTPGLRDFSPISGRKEVRFRECISMSVVIGVYPKSEQINY